MISSSKLMKMTHEQLVATSEELGLPVDPFSTKTEMVPAIMEQVEGLKKQAIEAGMTDEDVNAINDPIQLMNEANTAADNKSRSQAYAEERAIENGSDFELSEQAWEEQPTAVSEDEDEPMDRVLLIEKLFKETFFMKTIGGNRQKFSFTDIFGRNWTIEKTSDGKRWSAIDVTEGAVFADTRKQIAYTICSITSRTIVEVCKAKNVQWQDFSFDDIVAFSKPVEKLDANELEKRMME